MLQETACIKRRPWEKVLQRFVVFCCCCCCFFVVFVVFFFREKNQQNEAKKQNKTKQNKTKQNKTKQNKTKESILILFESVLSAPFSSFFSRHGCLRESPTRMATMYQLFLDDRKERSSSAPFFLWKLGLKRLSTESRKIKVQRNPI